MDPELITFEGPPCHTEFWSERPAAFPVAVLLYELRFSNGSNGGAVGSEASIWPCLTASGRQILIFYHVTNTCPSVDLRIRDVECPELLAELCLIPEVCPTASSHD